MKYCMNTLEKTVKKIYDRIGVNEPDVPISELAKKLKVNLIYYDDISFYLDGFIFIDRKLTKKKQKEIFAHELGHCLCHVGNQLKMNDLFRQYQEFKADNFALHFCVPTFMLLKIKLPKYRYAAAAIISDTFCVTNEFALKRIEHYEKQLFGVKFHKEVFCRNL